MATNKTALILPGDKQRFDAALAWIANVANTAVKKIVVTPALIQAVLEDEHGYLEDLTYGILAGTPAREFINALNQKSGARIPNGLDKVFQAFFSVWDTALQCDACNRLGISANPNRDGVHVVPEPERCLGNDGCRGTLCDTSSKTSIRVWPDGKIVPITNKRYRYEDADYPIHDVHLAASINDQELLQALAGVSIGHFFRFCVVTGRLFERCNVNKNVRAIWEFLTGENPMRYAAVLGPVIQASKDWTEGEEREKGEEMGVGRTFFTAEQLVKTIFLYHAKDANTYAEDLAEHLSPLRRELGLALVSSAKAPLGNESKVWTRQLLDGADLVIAFTSPGLLGDDEMIDMLEASLNKKRRVIPIMARQVNLVGTRLKGLVGLPRHGGPVKGDHDYADISGEIQSILTKKK